MLKYTRTLKIVSEWDPVQLAPGADSLVGYLDVQLEGEKGSRCGPEKPRTWLPMLRGQEVPRDTATASGAGRPHTPGNDDKSNAHS